jgi:hypothetical protein
MHQTPPTMTPEQAAEIFHNILCKQSFKDWYDFDFESYVIAEEGAPTKDQILKELTRQIAQEI